jgi:hypothetical protein
MNARTFVFTPQAVMNAILDINNQIEADLRLYKIIDPTHFLPPDRLGFFLGTIAFSISPNFGENLSDVMWNTVEVAISELYQDGVVPSGPWAELEIHAADRSIRRALNGDRRVINSRMKTACLPISQAERNYYPNRDEGELYLSRGPKPKGLGRFLFARLWLEIVECEKPYIANYRIEKHFVLEESVVRQGIKSARGGIEEMFMIQLIRRCVKDCDLRDDVRAMFRSEYGKLL